MGRNSLLWKSDRKDTSQVANCWESDHYIILTSVGYCLSGESDEVSAWSLDVVLN